VTITPSPAKKQLDALFTPRSVAVVGVSSTGRGIGAATLKTIQTFGFRGDLAVVNPSADSIGGVSCYHTLAEVPFPIDLVLMFTAADRVHATVEESVAVGAAAGVVFASGFSELGDHGAGRQQALTAMARETGFRFLGPNCQGVVSYKSRLAATFSNALRGAEGLSPGRIAYIGQSGAIGGSIFDLGRERGCVPSVWVSTGNQGDLDVVEVADCALDRDDVEMLMLYLEQMPRGDVWEAMCARASELDKRVVVLRSGTTAAGRIAVASHTGALVSADRAFELVSSKYGVVSVRDIDEMLDVALAHRAGLSRVGRGVAIVTTSGGAGGLAADAAERAGLTVPSFSGETVDQLADVLPAFATAHNPTDVTADLVSRDPDRFGEVCRLISIDPNVDQVLVVISVVLGRTAEMLAEALVRALPRMAKPLTVVYVASRDRTQDVRAILNHGGVVVFDSIAGALLAAGAVNRAERAAAGAHASDTATDARVRALTEAEGAVFLDAVGIARPPGVLATTRRQAHEVAQGLGTSVVLKVQSASVTHKTEVGAVRVGVPVEEVGDVFDEVVESVRSHDPTAVIDGVLVQALAPKGVELLIGVQVQENWYPPLVTVGIGGTAVELYADLASGTLPIDEDGALALLRKLRGWPLLDGHRSAPHADVAAAARSIAAAGRLCELLGENLVEFEINPLIVHADGEGATAVDFVAYLLDPDPMAAQG
jgi:acyl-CoA synthetase (NDP forming)